MRGAEPLLVAAASDLAPVEAALREVASNQSITVRFVFSSSGQLANQIRAGAPYDVFLSANMDFVRALEAEGKLMVGAVRPYARGRLGIWSKSGRVRSLEDLGADWVRSVALANPAHAPYGVAARDALQRAGVWDRLAGRVVYGENVRQAFQFAETGNADAAIVAWPLVRERPGAVPVPESAHAPLVQGAAVVQRTGQAEAARAFVEMLVGPVGQKVLRAAGWSGAK